MRDEAGTVTTGDGVELVWRRLGSGGPPVLVPASSWCLDDLAPLARGRTLVGYDVRGQGRSARVPDDRIGFERDVADLETVRGALGLHRITLLGWSYYGAVAAAWARTRAAGVGRMLLVAPVAPRAQPHWRGYLAAFGRRLDTAALRRLEEQRRARLPDRDPVAWCRAHTELVLRVYVDDPACLSAMRSSPCTPPNLDPERVNQQTLKVIEGMGDYDWRADFTACTVPVLLVHGDRDPVPLAGSREWLETLPDARLEVLEGCGHMPWLEQPQRFFELADGFLPKEPS